MTTGDTGTDSEWLIEKTAFEVVPHANRLVEAWNQEFALTEAQKASFKSDGYLLVPNAVPEHLIDTARDVIDARLNEEGGRAWYESTEGKAQTIPELLDLFWDEESGAQTLAQSLLGVGNATSVLRAQLAIRFPDAEVIKSLSDPSYAGLDPQWHVDGTCKGKDSPGLESQP